MNSQRVLWLTPSMRFAGEASAGEVPASALRDREQLPVPLGPVQIHSTSPATVANGPGAWPNLTDRFDNDLGAGAITAFQTKGYQASATVLISFSGQTTLDDVYYATEASQKLLSSYATIAGGQTTR